MNQIKPNAKSLGTVHTHTHTHTHSLLGDNLEYQKKNIKTHELYSFFCYTISKNCKENHVSIFIY